jgi:putative ABC transport system permease protein
MLSDYFSLAFGNLRHRGLRSWLTILGIFIGIAAVVSLISMGQGLRTAVTGQFGGLSIDRITVENKGTGFGPPGSTVVEKLSDHDVDILESINGVDKIVTRNVRVTDVEYNDVSGFVYVGDIPDSKENRDFIYEGLDIKAAEGKLLEGETGKVMLGNNFLTTDDFGKEFRVGKTVLIHGKEFEIIGFAEKASTFVLNGAMFMNSKDLHELLDIEGEYDIIVVQVQDKDRIEEVAEEIGRKFRDDRNEDLGEETFVVQTSAQALDSANTILDIINAIVIGIASISLVVGGVGIANTMYTSVVERTREIGVMKSVGARNKDILLIFLIEAGLLGLAGGIVGAVIGLGGALAVSSIANAAFGSNLFIISVSWPLLIGAVSFSFLVGVLSGILPALQASKLNVVDALRR